MTKKDGTKKDGSKKIATKKLRLWILTAALAGGLVGCGKESASSSASSSVAETAVSSAAASSSPAIAEQLLFDDFSYADLAAFEANGWKYRTQVGHPGIPGAVWSAEGFSFIQDIPDTAAGVLRMASVTDGTGANTRQSQICHARKYREGTYAARIFFRDAPTYGPDGDQIVQSFYAISPLKAPMDPDYSETDFEYLPNGGWGAPAAPAMWTTTWETFQLEPWTKDNEFNRKDRSYAGWHTLVYTVMDNRVKYYVDGELIAEHSDKVYPEDFMSINFNQWFVPKGADGSDGPIASSETREYQEDLDWVFHSAHIALTTEQVEARVAELRANNQTAVDTVPEQNPPLESPCGL